MCREPGYNCSFPPTEDRNDCFIFTSAGGGDSWWRVDRWRDSGSHAVITWPDLAVTCMDAPQCFETQQWAEWQGMGPFLVKGAQPGDGERGQGDVLAWQLSPLSVLQTAIFKSPLDSGAPARASISQALLPVKQPHRKLFDIDCVCFWYKSICVSVHLGSCLYILVLFFWSFSQLLCRITLLRIGFSPYCKSLFTLGARSAAPLQLGERALNWTTVRRWLRSPAAPKTRLLPSSAQLDADSHQKMCADPQQQNVEGL